MEKGMGRKFAREWYNINRAILIAEHQQRMDAKRTPVDLYMERFFQCADPSVVDNGSKKVDFEELIAQMRTPFSFDGQVEQREASETKQVVQEPPKPVAVAVRAERALPKKTVAAAPQELSELDMAVGFITCN